MVVKCSNMEFLRILNAQKCYDTPITPFWAPTFKILAKTMAVRFKIGQASVVGIINFFQLDLFFNISYFDQLSDFIFKIVSSQGVCTKTQ